MSPLPLQYELSPFLILQSVFMQEQPNRYTLRS